MTNSRRTRSRAGECDRGKKHAARKRSPTMGIWILWFAACALVGCAAESDRETRADKASGGVVAEIKTEREWIVESQDFLEKYRDTDDVTNTKRAETAALQAVGDDSTTLAILQLARVRVEQRYYDEAVSLLSRVLTESRDHSEAWGLMGDALLRMGHYRNADSCYNTMYGIDDSFDALRRIAHRDELFGKFDDAVSAVDKAIEGAKDWASARDLAAAHAQLALVFFSHGFVDAARENIDRSLALLPDVVPRLAVRADILRTLGLTDEADRMDGELAERSPNPYYISRLARIHYRNGETAVADSLVAKALAEYERLGLEYSSIIARRYIEFLLEFDVDREQALKLAYARSRKQRDIYAYELLAWAYHKNERHDHAWSSIALALRREATDPRVIYRAALIAKAAGKEDKFQIFSARALERNPLADVMYREGNLGGAEW